MFGVALLVFELSVSFIVCSLILLFLQPFLSFIPHFISLLSYPSVTRDFPPTSFPPVLNLSPFLHFFLFILAYLYSFHSLLSIISFTPYGHLSY